MINYIFLFIGIVYVTFLPGFVFTEFLLPKLAFWKKLPLYFISSVILSCYFTYAASLLLGFNRFTVLICFLIFFAAFAYLAATRGIKILTGIKKYPSLILTGLSVYGAFFVALLPAIFSLYNGYFVMSGPNWQDTAMHLSIIESLTQGNFPPQAPYFSGQPLTYYYFSDFHAAIVNVLYGRFFPQILILLNPFMAATFFFSVFALAYQISKKTNYSILAGIMAVLYGNLGFINLLKDLVVKKANYISLIASEAYHLDGKFLQMIPMADYFLQNRPMMVGLPVFAMAMALLLSVRRSKEYKARLIIIAGILVSSLVKFQLFGFVISWIFFGIYFGTGVLLKRISVKRVFRYFLLFAAPSIVVVSLFSFSKIDQRSILNVFAQTFRWGSWQAHTPVWFLEFLFINLNVGLVVFLSGAIFKKIYKNRDILPVLLTSVVLLAIPLTVTFTIYEFDMLKFYCYLSPCISVVVAYIFAQAKHKKMAILAYVLTIIICSLTSVNLLFHSFYNKNEGYTYADYQAGIWMRMYTPQKSVYVTLPTVHSAPTDIAGRLRIISYINWPYSHGFNVGPDNVFSRAEDADYVYKTGDIASVKIKYGADYVFYGAEEHETYPEAGGLLDKNNDLKLIYKKDDIAIYEIL